MVNDAKKIDYFFNALQQAHAHQKTGLLTATNGNEVVKIFVKEGMVIHATGFQKKILLGYLLQNKGIITAKQLEECLEQSKKEKQSLGKILVLNEYITFDTLSAMIRKQAVLTIAALLIWPNIKFSFKETPPNEDAIIPTRIDIIETIYEAVRRIEKISIIKRYLTNPALVFEKVSLINPNEVSLTTEESDVYERVNGTRSIARIVEESGMGENDVYRYLLTLFAIGVIDVAGKEDEQNSPETAAVSPVPEDKPSTPIELEGRLSGDTVSLGDLKKKILSNMKDFPPMLKIALKAREILSNANFNFKEISTVIEKDPAMASRILQMANSSYYGLVGQVSSVQHASVVLGYKILEEIIIAASAEGFFDKPLEGYRLNPQESWRHSLTVAFSAKALAEKKTPALESDAFTAGLFHDIGKIALNPFVLQDQNSFWTPIEKNGATMSDVEKVLFGFDHAQLGSELCAQWNIPETITAAVKNHHSPLQSDGNELAYILYVVDILSNRELTAPMEEFLEGIDPAVIAFLDVETDVFKEIMEKAFEAFEKIDQEI